MVLKDCASEVFAVKMSVNFRGCDGFMSQHFLHCAQIRAALAYVENNPALEQYSAIKGVLQDYLASLQAPGEQSGQLAFTGSNIVLAFGAGAALIGGGILLRRRRAA